MLPIGPDAAAVEAVEGFSNYTGPTPPPGIYPSVVKQISIEETKTTKKMMLRAITEFRADKDDARKKYNGYAIFHYLVIPESKDEEYYGLQVGQINRLLDALSTNDPAVRKAFWSNQADLDAEGKKIQKIGKVNLTGKEGVPIIISARSENFNRPARNDKGKPILDPKTKKPVMEQVKNLRINDIFPSNDPVGKEPVPEPEIEEDDSSDFVDVADADSGLDADNGSDQPSADADVADEDADLWGGDEPTDESSTDAEEATSEDQLELPLETADDGADDADLIAQEVPEETPVTEEPAKPARKRRSAF